MFLKSACVQFQGLEKRIYLTLFEKVMILIKEYLKQTKTLNQAEPHHQTEMLHQPYLNL